MIDLLESDANTVQTFFHVTPTRNVPKIMRDGLIPKVGRRSRLLGEPVPAIYLFHSEADMDDAMTNWLGDEFGEDIRLALLAVTVPADAVRVDGAGYETVLTSPIPSSAIRVMNRDL